MRVIMTRWGVGSAAALVLAAGCVAPAIASDQAPPPVPARFDVSRDVSRDVTALATDTATSADVPYTRFFDDAVLRALIDTALANNPDLLATLQEIEMARAELRGVRGRLVPRVDAGVGAGLEKVGRYTSQGAGDASADITPGQRVPDPLSDLTLGFTAAWEMDIRGKIRNQRGAALARVVRSVEGSRYVRTALVAEVANTYYTLVALDAKLAIIRQAIELQRNELAVVKAQREAAVVTELAVTQFEALLLNAQALEFDVLQQLREAENRMNLLLGRFPQPVSRSASASVGRSALLAAGLPSQLLRNRPDIRRAEAEVAASKFDLRAARAEFFPEVNLAGGLGVRAFTGAFLFTLPASLIYSVASDVAMPLFNRSALHAEFAMASAAQQTALLAYRRTVLEGVSEVSATVSAVGNLEQATRLKALQAATLDRSVGIARDLFAAARANYLEVLTAQREAIDVKLELVDTQLQQQLAVTNLYRALGGGWK